MDDLDTALEIARTVPENEAEVKWKALGDRALSVWRFDLAKESFEKANDLSALMLLLLSIGDRKGLSALAKKAGTCISDHHPGADYQCVMLPPEEKGQNNLAFAITLQLGDSPACIDLLIKTHRAPEAALFARTYAPSQAGKAVAAWKFELTEKNRSKIANTVADPTANSDLFEEGWEAVLAKEEEALASCESLYSGGLTIC